MAVCGRELKSKCTCDLFTPPVVTKNEYQSAMQLIQAKCKEECPLNLLSGPKTFTIHKPPATIFPVDWSTIESVMDLENEEDNDEITFAEQYSD